jgi:transcriptional regulator NrdR family protein
MVIDSRVLGTTVKDTVPYRLRRYICPACELRFSTKEKALAEHVACRIPPDHGAD